MKRRIVFRKKRQNQWGMFLVTIVVCMLLLVVSVNSYDLKQTQEKYNDKENDIEELIQIEEIKAEDLIEYRKYTQTKKYVEEVAKDKLGLVNPNEIIYKIEE